MIAVREPLLMLGPNRVWRTYQGGHVLDKIEGKAEPADTHFPEDWIGSLTSAKNPGRESGNEGVSVVSRSDDALVSLKQLIEEDPVYYLGTAHFEKYGLDTRILVKFLDSAIRLHFQVHPTAQFSTEFLGSTSGKTEAYVILDVREDVKDPYIYAGFQRAPARDDLKKWILNQDIDSIEACFDKIPVKKGDVFLIPGGYPHALGEGILMVELMEASDLAVRFEFERGGYVLPEVSRFLGKDLGFALNVFNFRSAGPETFRCHPKRLRRFDDGSEQWELIGRTETECFAARETRIEKEVTKTEDSFYVGIVMEGQGQVSVGDRSWDLKPYDRFFAAASCGPVKFESIEGMRLLECAPPSVKI